MKALVLAAAAFAASIGTAQAQDLAAGEQSFRKCLPCHAVGPDARNKIGPILNGIDGRKTGTTEYNYTEANKKAEIVTPQAGAPALHWVISEPYERMIRKSGGRLSEKFMLKQGLGARYRPEVR
mgnify:CR=1 FL=1